VAGILAQTAFLCTVSRMPSMPSMSSTSRPARSAVAPLVLFAAVTATVGCALAIAHEPRRWVQSMALAVPLLLWLLWPVVSVPIRRLRAVAVGLWSGAFIVDAAIRAYLIHTYQAAPNSAFVIGSVANTSASETAQHVALSWPGMVPWALGALAGCVLVGAALRRDAAHRDAPAGPVPAGPRRARIGLALALLPAVAAAYAIKPWRRHHPMLFWPRWVADVESQRASWSALETWRDATHRRALQAAPSGPSDPATVVLVIADSVNRNNLGLYGYPRDTTPRLDALHDAMRDALVVFRRAWSVDAGTIPAIRSLLQFGATDAGDTAHVLALARAAGYRTWWISTHDDIAIEQVHARLADSAVLVSRTPGRASRTQDDELIAPLRDALADPSPHKFIVLHAMGAHPHYALRFPRGDNPFDDEADMVSTHMASSGRRRWVRRARDQYDAALRHHDRVIARTFDLTRDRAGEGGYVAWMYLSDHGQEVGHAIDHAGHSAATVAGYEIPALVWQSRPRRPLDPDVEHRPFRADWAAWTVAHLLALRWPGEAPGRDALDAAYRWERPAVATRVPGLGEASG
jgi:heptose-I-phosphate ethanolaminephosphotransferase